VLREVSGYMSDVRVSPLGDRIAYFEHPRKWDDRGSVNIVDLAGKNTVLSEGYWSERGLAWSPDGEEILFSASLSSGPYTVYAVTPAGRRRIAYQAPGGLNIQDVARDGRWLVNRVDYRYVAMVHTPGAAEDRDLSWLNTSHARALSQDGQTLLFAETGLGSNYAVCLRKTDGSPVVRLGEGWPADLSAYRSAGNDASCPAQCLPRRPFAFLRGELTSLTVLW
jgi:sugar lactone lactonase YvrE